MSFYSIYQGTAGPVNYGEGSIGTMPNGAVPTYYDPTIDQQAFENFPNYVSEQAWTTNTSSSDAYFPAAPVDVAIAPAPRLKILCQPQSTFRFRYASESKSEGHGYLFGCSNGPKNKPLISVQLENWHDQRETFIRCSLVTDSVEPVQHFHRLRIKKMSYSAEAEIKVCHDELVCQQQNWVAEFSGLSILMDNSHAKQIIIAQNNLEEMNVDLKTKEKQVKAILANHRNTVKLKFEAFAVWNGINHPISPAVYSQTIRNKKNPNEKELCIVKMVQNEGLCTGNEEVCIFVEHVDRKDIGIRFFEKFGDYICWSAIAQFSPKDVHHGFAIAFKTPYYRENIQGRVTVEVQLFRRSDENVYSDSTHFTYLPHIDVHQQRRISRHASEPTPQLTSMGSTMHPNQYQHPENFFTSVGRNQTFSLSDSALGTTQQPLVPQQIHHPQETTPRFDTTINAPMALNEFQGDSGNSSPYDETKIECVVTFTGPQHPMEQGNSSIREEADMHGNDVGLFDIISEWLNDKLMCDNEYQNDAATESPTKASSKFIDTHRAQTVFTRDVHGNHALHYAVRGNNIDIVHDILTAAKCLGDNGREFINTVNNIGLTPLHLSVLENRTEATTLLLQFGADPNLKDFNGNTAVHIAAIDGRSIDSLRLLLNKIGDKTSSAYINAQNFKGETPLHLAVKGKNTKGAKLLFEKGADASCKEKNGRSALHTAVEKAATDLVHLLLRNKSVDINAQCSYGRTALDIAEAQGSDSIRNILIAHGAESGVWNSSESSEDTDSELSDWDSEESDDFETKAPQRTLLLPPTCDQNAIAEITNAAAVLKMSDSFKIQPDEVKELQETEKSCNKTEGSQIICSTKNCMMNQEKFKQLDNRIIAALAGILNTSCQSWEKLAESLDLPTIIIKNILEKQPSPLIHLLSNLESWDVPSNVFLKKLRELQLEHAAALLEDYLAA